MELAWRPDEGTIDYKSSGDLHILLICTASDFGLLVIVNRLVNLQVWADAKLRKKYSQVP